MNEETKKADAKASTERGKRELAQATIEHYKSRPDVYGLCAWCQSYFSRESGHALLPRLTDEQMEATRHDGTSHGCCGDCRDRMMAEAHKKEETKDDSDDPTSVDYRITLFADTDAAEQDELPEQAIMARVERAIVFLQSHPDLTGDQAEQLAQDAIDMERGRKAHYKEQAQAIARSEDQINRMIIEAADQRHLTVCKSRPDIYGLCAWCRHYYLLTTGGRVSPALTDEQMEVTRHDGTTHGCCPECRNRMNDEAHRPVGYFSPGDRVRVIKVADEYGDDRNIGRFGTIVGIITPYENIDDLKEEGVDVLYEVEFTDGRVQEPHWMDLEAKLPADHSAHYHSELVEA